MKEVLIDQHHRFANTLGRSASNQPQLDQCAEVHHGSPLTELTKQPRHRASGNLRQPAK